MGQLVFQATLGGQVNLVGPNTASTFNINVPAVAGNMVTTGDTGTVTNTMCATSVYTAPGTIGSGTPNTGSFTSLAYSTTLTGGTGIVNLGSGQFYKDASGNVGIGTSSPTNNLTIGNGGGGNNLGVSLSRGATTNFYEAYDGTKTYIAGCDASISYVKIGSLSSTPVGFVVGNSEKMRIDTSGNLLVGTTSATSLFTVKAQANSYANGIATVRSGATDWWSMLCSTSTNLYFGYNNLDRAYINSSTGSFNAVSDSRLKKNIVDIQYGLQAVLDLHPVAYNMNDQEDTDEKALGFIAQEALEVVPESVSEMMGGMYGMDKVSLIPVLVKAIQEQQAIIASLTQRIETLEAK